MGNLETAVSLEANAAALAKQTILNANNNKNRDIRFIK
jgi:hypothetical protein